MANQAKIMGQVTMAVDFIVDKLKDDIITNNQTREVNLTQQQTRALFSLIEMSVKDSYNRSMDQILKSID
jgi:hypothetical protein